MKPMSNKIYGVMSDSNCFIHKMIHVSCCPVQHESTAAVNVMPCVDTVLHYHRLLRLFDTDVSHMLLASSLDGSPSLMYIYS